MTGPNLHNFRIGRWVRLLTGPFAGKRGQIVGRHGDELELLVNGGPYWPIDVAITEVRQAYVDAQLHGPHVAPNGRTGSD